MTSSILSRTSSSSSDVGDYIGTESCFDVTLRSEENDVASVSEVNKYRYGGRRREEREARAAAAREFPPPIPLLAQTENLPSHMPWVLKRVVTSDGRLILREEKVRHHEYFRAHRSNGRLTLHLVPLDDDVLELPRHDNNDVDDNHNDDDGNDDNDNDDDEEKEDNVDEVVLDQTVVVESGVINGGGSPRGKCLKSCFIDMQVREIRPVLS